MAEQEAHILEVLVSQMRQHRDIDAVLSETLGVLEQAEPSEPICNLLHRQPPTDLTLSVLDRQDRQSTTRANSLYALEREPHGITGCPETIQPSSDRWRSEDDTDPRQLKLGTRVI